MTLLPSTRVIGVLGLAAIGIGIGLLAADDLKGEWHWFAFGVCALLTGIALTVGAFARGAMLRARGGKNRSDISSGLFGDWGCDGGSDGGGGSGADGGGGGGS